MKIEVGKFYKTRSGFKARIYAVDGFGGYTIHGATLQTDGWIQCTWQIGGALLNEGMSDFDLVDIWTEPKPKLKAFVSEEGCVFMATSDPWGKWKRMPHLDEP